MSAAHELAPSPPEAAVHLPLHAASPSPEGSSRLDWARAWRGIAVLLALGGLGLLTVRPIDDPDLWWLLGAGRYMVETRAFLSTDPFSYTANGATWINHAWGFELLLYAIYGGAGTTGLILFQALVTVGIFGMLYRTLRREGAPTWAALALLTAGAVATQGFWRARPQLVTYLGLAVFGSALRDFRAGRQDRRGLLWLPLFMVVWVNLHAGFLIGLVLVGLTLAGEVVDAAFAGREPRAGVADRVNALAVTLGLSVAAAFLNPFHYRALLFPWQVVSDRLSQDFITEWASLPFQDPQVVLLEGLVVLFVVLSLLTRRPPVLSELGVVLVFVYLALPAARNAPLLVIVLLPILGHELAEWLTTRSRGFASPALRWSRVVAGGAGVALVAALGAWRGGGPAAESLVPSALVAPLRPGLGIGGSFPAGAVAYLQAHRLPGRLLNEYVWGGYLIWTLYPDYRVSIDGRAAVYGPALLGEHIALVDLHPGWAAALDHLAPDVALVRAGSPLALVLRASPGWETRYEDSVATVLGRRPRAW